jgi:DNA-binding NarL/FixJ family response regulator
MLLNILIADDSVLIRERLIKVISEFDDVFLVGQATTAEEAINLAQKHKPDVVILDIRMPGGNSIKALQTIKQTTPSKVIMLTAYPFPQYRTTCLQLGADAFLDKNDEFDLVAEVLANLKSSSEGP